MSLTSNDLAILTCRSACARAGAARAAFTPDDTVDSVGNPLAGPFYLWSRTDQPTTTWTNTWEP